MSKLSYKTLLIILFSLLIAIVALWKFVLPKQKVSASWWNDGWNYRKAISISNTSGSNLTDFQISLSIGTSALIASGKMQSDCDDIRITDINGNLLAYWIEPGTCNTDTTKTLLKINSFPTTGTTIYFYYGNSSVNSNADLSIIPKTCSDVNAFLGTGLFYVNPDNTTNNPVQAYCDMDTNGGGWTLVASWDTAQEWTKTSTSISSVFDTTAKNTVSSNFGNATIYDFRILASDTITTTGSSAYADWFYHYNTATSWKEVWAPSANLGGFIDSTYRSTSPRQALKPFDYSYNIKFSYQITQTWNNLSDWAYTGADKAGCLPNYWAALTSPGNPFGVFSLAYYSGSNGTGCASAVSDGSLGICPSDQANCITGQDRSTNNVKIGYDDGQADAGFGSIGTTSVGEQPGVQATTKLWWFIRKDTPINLSYSYNAPSAEEVGGGPMAYWKFDEGSGTTAYDSIGLSNGSITGATYTSEDQCISGTCLYFNGSAYVNTNYGAGHDISTDPISISMWVKPTQSGNYMFLSPNQGTNQRFYFATYNGKWDMGVYTSGWGSGTIPVELNKWAHIEIVANGSTVYMYVNNKLNRQISYTSFTFPNNIAIGSHGPDGAYKWIGYVDDVKIYPYARTTDQIKQDYNSRGSSNGSSVNLGVQSSTAPSLNSKLVAYYKFDEGTGTTVYDSTTNQNNGTINKAIWSNQGKYNKGLSFSPNQESLLLDYRVWKAGQVGSVTGFSQNGSTSENFRVVDTDPFGRKVTVWEAAQNDVTSDSDGGWNSSNIAVDQTKMYRFSTWIRRTVLGNGTYYFGTYGKNSSGSNFGVLNRSNGAVNTNPYFRATSGNEILSTSSWFLLVAHIWPSGSGTGSVYSDTGLYNSNGTKIATPSDFVWQDGTYYTNHRSYLYYSTDPSTVQQWAYPRIDVIDGNEPSIQELLNGYDSYGSDVSTTISDSKESFSFWYDKNSTGNWQHIVKSSSNYYVNGKLSTPEEYPIYVLGNDIFIGRTTDSDFATGLIDEVKIYNTALTSDEIKQDYNASAATQFGATNQTIGGTTTSLEYCIPGDTSYCASPVAEWKMDEKTGTTIKDISGNNNTGIFGTGNSAPTWTSGKIGAGLRFDGVDDYVSSGKDLLTSSPMTICTWFKLNTTSQDSAIIGNFASSYWTSYGKGFKYTNGTLYLMCENNNDKETISTSLNDTNWHYACGVIRTSTGKLYLDGTQVASGDLNSDGYNYWTDIGAATWRNTENTKNFNGLIDHVKIYNYARTPAQIAYDYNKGAPVGWWKLDDCQGLTAFDSSGLGNNAAISIGPSGTQNSAGTCQIGTSAAWTNGAIGKYNSSLNFDGTDDYANAGNNTIFNLSNGNTFSMWINGSGRFSQGATLLNRQSQGNPGFFWLMIYQNKGFLQYWNGSSNINLTTTNNLPISQGQWFHYTITISGETVSFYVNGKLIESKNATGIDKSQIISNLYIGSYQQWNSNWQFQGQIDDVRIYNYALTSEQVKTVYNNGAVNFN